MKKLGFGMMRLPILDKNDAASIDYELVKQMVDEFIKRGFTYFDTAWMYCGHKSQNAVKECIVKRYPRDAFTITTKLPSYLLKDLSDRDKVFNSQLEQCGVDYFDYYLLHDVNFNSYKEFTQYDCFSWIKEKKEKGLAKKIAFSFHSTPELLDEILTKYPFFDYVQLQINYLDWDALGIDSRKCYEVAVKHNMKVIVMEPVKGGALANVSPKVEKLFKDYDSTKSIASWAIRYVASLDNVFMVLSGMSNMEQLLDNTSFMQDFKPLTLEESSLCLDAGNLIMNEKAIQCTGCFYCTVNCPKNIQIPRYFSLYNEDLKEYEKGWTSALGYYQSFSDTHAKPTDCIKCGQCENICPQHLHIRDLLIEVSGHFKNK